MGLFDILGRLLDIFVRFIPRVEVIATTHCGIAWLFGRWPVRMNAGVYIVWPVIMRFERVPLVWQTRDCWEKPATTKDGVTVTYDCGIVYRVSDPKLQVSQCEDRSAIVEMHALELIHDEITEHDFSDANKALLGRVFQKRVVRLLKEELAAYGMEPKVVKITAFARSRVLHHIGNVANVTVGGNSHAEE